MDNNSLGSLCLVDNLSEFLPFFLSFSFFSHFVLLSLPLESLEISSSEVRVDFQKQVLEEDSVSEWTTAGRPVSDVLSGTLVPAAWKLGNESESEIRRN